MSQKTTTVLIVEDESSIRDMLKFALAEKNFILIEAENTKDAEHKLANQLPDIILLDWMLPGKSGIDFARQLKKNQHTQNIPIIMLTAKAEEENKIKGFAVGADDYVTKPFSPRELAARIQAVLRRGPLINAEGIIHFDNFYINTHTQAVAIDNEPLILTPITYRLLLFFITHPNKIYSREQLLQQVWVENIDKDLRTVDVQIKRLREILAPYGYKDVIKTVRSVGYLLSISSTI